MTRRTTQVHTLRAYAGRCPHCDTLNVLGPGGSHPPARLQACSHLQSFSWEQGVQEGRGGHYVFTFAPEEKTPAACPSMEA